MLDMVGKQQMAKPAIGPVIKVQENTTTRGIATHQGTKSSANSCSTLPVNSPHNIQRRAEVKPVMTAPMSEIATLLMPNSGSAAIIIEPIVVAGPARRYTPRIDEMSLSLSIKGKARSAIATAAKDSSHEISFCTVRPPESGKTTGVNHVA